MDVVGLLKQYGIRPSKGLGQHFLVSEEVLDEVVAASELGAEDVVLEVGPGLGLMTQRLAAACRAVVAVELDRRMVAILAERLAHLDNVHLVEEDILAIDPAATVAGRLGLEAGAPPPYKVVANLPYYITSAALRHLLDRPWRPTLLTVMVQREVAQRLVAGPGQMSLLAVSVQAYGRPEMVAQVPAGAFYPAPKVDSAVVRVRVYEEPLVPEALRQGFFRLVRAGFAQKRKMLANSLGAGLALGREPVEAALARAGIDPRRRAQTLSVADWLRLAEVQAAG